MSDADYLLALRLQAEFNKEPVDVESYQSQKRRRVETDNGDDLNSTQNIVHPEWEQLDPTPDVYSLFGAFDIKFFQGKLKCVELEWSKRMYTCAGICYQRRNQLGMSIIIRLSEPLLKLRPRKDLIETLLHEMIHAYLFILGIREPNGGHGPNFKKIMTGINKIAGTNITVYHSFHDEVNAYKTHIWRCNGICQHRAPFYGWVRRTANRAPSQNDLWWDRHKESCGGCFQKVSGPEPKRNSKKPKTALNNNQPKINTLFNNGKGGSYGGGVRSNGIGSKTQVITGKKGQTTTAVPPPTSLVSPTSRSVPSSGNLGNVVGFKDLTGEAGSNKPSVPSFSGGGRVLGSISPVAATGSSQSVSEAVRGRWATKFESSQPSSQVSSTSSNDNAAKDDASNIVNVKPIISPPVSHWEIIDDEISIREEHHEVIDVSDGEDFEFFPPQPSTSTPDKKPVLPKQSSEDRRKTIQNEIVADGGEAGDTIELIDDEFDDELHNKSLELLTDSNVIQDIFGTDTLIEDFNLINDVIMKDPENVGNPGREIITCPVCQERMSRETLDEHLDGCLGIKVEKKHRGGSQASNPLPFYRKKPPEPRKRRVSNAAMGSEQEKMLKAAGYSTNDIQRMCLEEDREAEEYNRRILTEMAEESKNKSQADRQTNASPIASTSRAQNDDDDDDDVVVEALDQHPCPVCNTMISAVDINSHLDECLQNCADDD